MKTGDKVQYNKAYSPDEVVTVLKIDGNNILVQFPSGTKVCTRLSGLWPLTETSPTESLQQSTGFQLQLKLEHI